MIPIESAQAEILAACSRRPSRSQPLADALGCVLAERVVATENVPPFANSAMDGFAVRAGDTTEPPVELVVTATQAAGSALDVAVDSGEAVRIMTGAPIPTGADAVVMVESTEAVDPNRGDPYRVDPNRVDPNRVRILTAARQGDHIRPAGDDLAAGAEVFETGIVLSPGHIGVLASLGYENVTVYPRLRVGVLSTGDELRQGPGALAPGQIRDSNRPMLLGLLSLAGCIGVDLGMVGDDEQAITAAIEAGLDKCDALVTSGGVSVGDFDYVKSVLGRLGKMNWWQVAVRPAKPLAFGVVGGSPVFGLPGNPVSAMVSFELFARPAFRAMSGHTDIHRPRWPAIAGGDFRRRPDSKIHFVRGIANVGEDGRLHVRSAGAQGSHHLAASAGANCLVVMADGDGAAAGETVEVMVTGTL